jgi:hypothetical protein
LEPEEGRPGEYGTGGEETRRAWNRKRIDPGSLEVEDMDHRKSGIEEQYNKQNKEWEGD